MALQWKSPAGNAPEKVYMDRPEHFFVLGSQQEFTFGNEMNGHMQAVRFVTPMVNVLWQRAVTEQTARYSIFLQV